MRILLLLAMIVGALLAVGCGSGGEVDTGANQTKQEAMTPDGTKGGGEAIVPEQ